MSVNIYDSTTDTLHKVAGLVDDTDLKQDIEDIQAVIPSSASSSNKLAARNEIYILSNQYNGATYSTVNALLEKVAADMLAKGGYGGAVGSVWTGKSYFSGTYGTNGSTAGNARLHFENAQDGYTECSFSFTSSGLGTVRWFNDVTTSSVTSGSTAPITSGGVSESCPYVVFKTYSNEGNIMTYTLADGHYECKVYYYGGLCGIYDMVKNQFGNHGGRIATVWEDSVFKDYTLSIEKSTGVVSMSGTAPNNVQFVITALP